MTAPKHGRTYRRSRITRADSSKLPVGLRRYTTAKGNRRAIVGYNFHRARAMKEQPQVALIEADSGALAKADFDAI